MLDFVIGPIVRVIDHNSFVMQVTHIGTHNKYVYGNYETVCVPPNNNPNATLLSVALIGRRVRCNIQYRDNYNRLNGDVYFETETT